MLCILKQSVYGLLSLVNVKKCLKLIVRFSLLIVVYVVIVVYFLYGTQFQLIWKSLRCLPVIVTIFTEKANCFYNDLCGLL